MDEVGRAVQRVNDPDKLGVFCSMFASRLLRPDAVARIRGQQGFYDRLLCSLVNFGHKVIGLLL